MSNRIGNWKHGQGIKGFESVEYHTWQAMVKRCNNPTDKNYRNYGARGIKVCPEWEKSFIRFYEDMGSKPVGKSLGRIDNNGPYCKENCRWESPTEQLSNTRRNVFLTLNGETKTLSEWSRTTGIKKNTLRMRIKCGWETERLLTEKTHFRGQV